MAAQLLILIPNTGMVATEFMKSLIGATQLFRTARVSFAIKTYEFSDIVMSRNYLLSFFMSHPDFTHALFLDSDLSFSGDQILRLLQFDEDFTVAAYPRRKLRLQAFHDLVLDNAARPEEDRLTPQQLLARANGYVLQYGPPPGHEFALKRRDGFVTVPGLGLGFSLLRRAVPEQMIDTGQAAALPRQASQSFRELKGFWDFFGHITDAQGSYKYGEDQSFCQRWVFGVGGDIWMDESAKIGHHGLSGFQGDFTVEPPFNRR
ncbi:hypothetical protein OE810_11200 [Rhodobacteraceae bacterium XHP0102]|nr:hypothetical protein [Rhodobacteraceae bacterium XHP0102]